jgi:hypothetical protein
MCWSGEASAVLAVAGFGTAAYVAYKGESKELWIRGCAEFCVNGQMAGNCRLVWRHTHEQKAA